jgi:predicted transcriptional regulator
MDKVSNIISSVICNSEGEFKQVFGKIIKDNKHTKEFFTSDKDGCMILALSDLTVTEYKIMMMLLGYMDFENYVYTNQRFIAETLKITQPSTSKTINKLLNRGFIFKEKVNGVGCYRVNAAIAWKGSNTKQYKEIIEKDMQYLEPIS